MKLLPNSQNAPVWVDDDFTYEVRRSQWRLEKDDYVVRTEGLNNKVYLHHRVLPKVAGRSVDHIDGNRLNNTRANLRYCSQAENVANAKARGGTSIYKGVAWHKASHGWQSVVYVNGYRVYLGIHTTEFGAAKVYDAAARTLGAGFHTLNFPGEGEQSAHRASEFYACELLGIDEP